MDRHASTIKRHRQSLKRRERNRAARSRVKTYIKNVEEATTQEAAETALKDVIKVLDTSAGTKINHPNKVARIKSRLTRMVSGRFAS